MRNAWLALALMVAAGPLEVRAGAPVYHTHTFAIGSAECPSGAPGLAPDGFPWGISLAGLRGWKLVVCPAAGETLAGTGSITLCAYSAMPWGPALWTFAPEFTVSMTGKAGDAADRCVTAISDTTVIVGLADRILAIPSDDFGGTTATFYLIGEGR
jgi:hypothetical protein